MIAVPTPGLPAWNGLRGSFRSWLRTWSSQAWHPSDKLPSDAGLLRAPPNAAVRVLVVDDNPVNLSVMSAQLEARGLETLLAADGTEAVTLACEWHFDLILMDLQMPILDGIEATAAIRRFEGSRSRPAVPVVAYTSTRLRPSLLATHGMNGVLPKPCDDQDLEDCLVQWCPAYRSELTARAVPLVSNCWQAENSSFDTGGKLLR